MPTMAKLTPRSRTVHVVVLLASRETLSGRLLHGILELGTQPNRYGGDMCAKDSVCKCLSQSPHPHRLADLVLSSAPA